MMDCSSEKSCGLIMDCSNLAENVMHVFFDQAFSTRSDVCVYWVATFFFNFVVVMM